MELLAGPILERPPSAKAGSTLRYAELSIPSPLPKPATLERWRRRFDEGTHVGLRVPEPCWVGDKGPLRPERASIDWLEAAASALRPATVIVPTGSSVTTGARDRERLRAYFSALPDLGDAVVVWRATGLWEPEALQSMAALLGVTGGIDAIDDPVPATDLVHAELRAEGLRQSFSHAVLADVLSTLTQSGASRAYVAVESSHAVREAKLLQALFEGGA